ncbi:MAG: hypothetical protein LBC56_07400 [Oscillospiraceae bacterium]|jgi:hypothetical protein|nr:hypothetical protein [Oscillospiraceae bacterium]
MKKETLLVSENVSDFRGKNNRQRRRRGILFGVLVNIFAFVGLVSVIIMIVRTATAFFDNTAERTELENYIQPVVMANILPFEHVEAIDPNEIKIVCLWSALLNNDMSRYERDPELNYYLMIPISDLDIQARRLFGSGLKLEHTGSIPLGDGTYYIYDEASQKYMVETSVSIDLYTPSILNIKKEAGQLILDVGYIPPSSPWEMNLQGDKYKPAPDMYKIFYINYGDDGQPYISMIQNMPEAQAGAYAGSSQAMVTPYTFNYSSVAPPLNSGLPDAPGFTPESPPIFSDGPADAAEEAQTFDDIGEVDADESAAQ